MSFRQGALNQTVDTAIKIFAQVVDLNLANVEWFEGSNEFYYGVLDCSTFDKKRWWSYIAYT